MLGIDSTFDESQLSYLAKKGKFQLVQLDKMLTQLSEFYFVSGI